MLWIVTLADVTEYVTHVYADALSYANALSAANHGVTVRIMQVSGCVTNTILTP